MKTMVKEDLFFVSQKFYWLEFSMAASSNQSPVIYYSKRKQKPICFIKMTRTFKNALMIEGIPYNKTIRSF